MSLWILYQKPNGPNPVGKSLPIMFAIVRTTGASPAEASCSWHVRHAIITAACNNWPSPVVTDLVFIGFFYFYLLLLFFIYIYFFLCKIINMFWP